MKTILSLTLVIALSTFCFAQSSTSSIADSDAPAQTTVTKKKKTVLKDNTNAVAQLNQQFQKAFRLPESVLGSGIEGKSFVNVHIDLEGNVTSFDIENSLGAAVDDAISSAMENITKVDPIVINGVAKARTIKMPVSITQ